MQKLFVNNFGDMAEPQRASYFRFLSSGIGEELDRLENPFFARIRVNKSSEKVPVLVYFYTSEMKVQGPNFDIETCLYKSLSYTIQIYIPAEYSYPISENSKRSSKNISFLNSKFKKKQRVKQTRVKQDIFFGEIPLMTDEGTFIINGCERIVISQIIRSPGIYFRKEFGSSIAKTKYNATIISNKGLWTTFIFDTIELGDPEIEPIEEQERIYIKLQEFKRDLGLSAEEKKNRQILDRSDDNRLYIYDFLKYFGLTIEEVADSLKYPSFLVTQRLGGATFSKKDVYPYTRHEDETLALVYRYFSNQRAGAFSIGELGRYRINLKLDLHLPKHVTSLTAHDFLGIINGLIELKYYDRMNDDIDDIKHKLVRSIGELLQNQIRVGVYRLQKNLAQASSRTTSSNLKSIELEDLSLDWESSESWILDPRPLTSSIRDFFKTSQLSQYMDQINPLAELTHKRRISVFGPNGLKRDHISTVIRDIHPSQYGRLCPVETPEGQNAGLINALAIFGRISSVGALETPYFVMNKGEIYSTKQPVFLDPDQEITTPVSFSDLSFNQEKKIDKTYISIKENHLFSLKKVQDVNFITISPLQIVSVATALIPFLEHDDANRALMGSNMQRQAVPLLYPQKPLVGTGLECVAVLDSGMVIKSYCEGQVHFSSSSLIEIKDKSGQIITYKIRKYQPSNQDTAINQRPIVWRGENVFSGQIIADGPSTNDGELSLGRNLTIAYMPWEGYNYEDAIVINERLINENSLTSVHIEEYETTIPYSAIRLDKEQKKKKKKRKILGEKVSQNDKKVKDKKETKASQETKVNKKTKVSKETKASQEIKDSKSKKPLKSTKVIIDPKQILTRDTKKESKKSKKEKAIEINETEKTDTKKVGVKLKQKKEEKIKGKTEEKSSKKTTKNKSSETNIKEKALIDKTKKISKNGKKITKGVKKNKKAKLKAAEPPEIVTRKVPNVTSYVCRHLGKNGIVRLGSYVKENDILIGRSSLSKDLPTPEQKLINAIYKRKDGKTYRDTSLHVNHGAEGRVIDIRVISNLLTDRDDLGIYMSGYLVRIYVAQIRKLQVGDKLAGRHGNKGIVSRILGRQDMPYLPDGTPIDIVFNPLGVPSRMNVGQIFECLLGLAGEKLGSRFKVFPFDEVYGPEASRVLVNQKLKEASLKSDCPWLFDPTYPGKILLRDGRTGEYFDNPITVGRSYILKLIHLVEDKIHARSTGPYAMITEQPLAGKSQKGGQRFGEMEVWALEAYGCSHTLQELLTIKSDDIDGRNDMYESIVLRRETEKPTPSVSESFLTLVRELHALGLDFAFHKMEGGFLGLKKGLKPSFKSDRIQFKTKPFSCVPFNDVEKDIFEELEERLQLRALASQRRIELYASPGDWETKDQEALEAKKEEKKRILEKLLKNKRIFE